MKPLNTLCISIVKLFYYRVQLAPPLFIKILRWKGGPVGLICPDCSHLLLYNHPNYEFFRKIFQKTDALIILLSWRVIYAYKYVLIKFDGSR